MKVNGVYQNNLIQAYKDTKKKIEKGPEVTRVDSLQISVEARNLQSITNEKIFEDSAKNIDALMTQIKQGTYHPNPALIAQKMMAIVKESGVNG